MKDRLQTLVETTAEVAGAEDLSRLLRRVSALYDVDNCIYYALNLGGRRSGEEFGAMTYPEAWHSRYEEVRYRDLDPVVRASLGGFAPFDWADLDWTGRPLRRLLAEAREFRIGDHGYTIPIHGPNGQFAMFSVSRQCADATWRALLADCGQELLLVAHHVHHRALELHDAAASQPPPALSPRERDALSLMASGLPRARIAHRLEISESTLRVYLDSARHKLGALNACHAVALAVRAGALRI